MLVIKGHKILLQPNNEQQTKFIQWCGTHRFIYNWGLERWKEIYEGTQKSPSTYALMREIVQLKKDNKYDWLKDVSKGVPRVALMHLEVAFQAFFLRCKKNNAQKGYPKWKSRKRSKMVFHLEPDQVRLDGSRVRLPKIGWVRMTKPLRWGGRLVSTIAISEYAGRWYISFNCEVEVMPVEKQGKAVGVDLGMKNLAVLSDGTQLAAPGQQDQAVKAWPGRGFGTLRCLAEVRGDSFLVTHIISWTNQGARVYGQRSRAGFATGRHWLAF